MSVSPTICCVWRECNYLCTCDTFPLTLTLKKEATGSFLTSVICGTATRCDKTNYEVPSCNVYLAACYVITQPTLVIHEFSYSWVNTPSIREKTISNSRLNIISSEMRSRQLTTTTRNSIHSHDVATATVKHTCGSEMYLVIKQILQLSRSERVVNFPGNVTFPPPLPIWYLRNVMWCTE
jgi:hypothetical protein